MSDYLERGQSALDGRERVRHALGESYPDMVLVDEPDLRALVADAKQLRAQATEYGIDATFVSTRSATFTVADNLGDALKALEEFDAKRGDVVCRQLVERPVGEWRKVGDAR